MQRIGRGYAPTPYRDPSGQPPKSPSGKGSSYERPAAPERPQSGQRRPHAAEGHSLHVDASVGALTEALRGSLAENKEALIELLERERVGPEAADRRGLVIRWSEYPVWVKLRDPLTGEWHEVRSAECLPGGVGSANRKRSLRGATNNGGAA